nr:nicotinate-nucleotide adenylyltransferase [Paenibacillus soyae]
MGGTFDPIHAGHLIAAETAREQADLDEVWFIPTADPPLKDRAPLATGERRVEMVRLATQGNGSFRVLDIELKRGGVSYSIDTVTELRKLHPGHAFSYIIGSDRINDLPRWHRIEELSKLAGFIGLERPGEPLRLTWLPDFLRDSLTLAKMPQIGISSTEIRSRFADGRSARYLVPEPVYAYIRGLGLYGSSIDD